MSVRTTDERHVALYDSVTGLAFGPTFESTEHAEDFLRYFADWDESDHPVSDPRSARPGNLAAAHGEWREQVNA